MQVLLPLAAYSLPPTHTKSRRAPFLAWLCDKGKCSQLLDLCPVRLLDPCWVAPELDSLVIDSAQSGDFSGLLQMDSFVENRFMELDPAEADSRFSEGIEERFGLAHSFEYLVPREESRTVWGTAETWLRVIGRIRLPSS